MVAMLPVGSPRREIVMPDDAPRGEPVAAATVEGRAGTIATAAESRAATTEANASAETTVAAAMGATA